MERTEKEVLSKYKLWQELFKEDSHDVKDTDEKFFACDCSSCGGCGCYAGEKAD